MTDKDLDLLKMLLLHPGMGSGRFSFSHPLNEDLVVETTVQFKVVPADPGKAPRVPAPVVDLPEEPRVIKTFEEVEKGCQELGLLESCISTLNDEWVLTDLPSLSDRGKEILRKVFPKAEVEQYRDGSWMVCTGWYEY